jgi:hypothetical protein
MLLVLWPLRGRSDYQVNFGPTLWGNVKQRQSNVINSKIALTDQSHDCDIRNTYLTGTGFGALAIGRTIPEVQAKCEILRDTTELDEEAQPERVVTVRTTRGILKAFVDSGKVWRIIATSTTIRTADSLGLGSTLSQLLSVSDAHGIEGEGGLYITLARYCGLSFRLSYDIPEQLHRSDWNTTHLRQVPDSTTVDQVLATGCH